MEKERTDGKYEVSIKEQTSNSLSDSSTKEKHGFFSKAIDFLNKLSLEGSHGLPVKDLFLYNYDLKPLESKRRTWHWYNYVYFCISECFNVNTWQIAGTGVQNGLNWWSCYLTVWIGYIFCGCFISAFARIGNAYHIGFPVSCRSSFGIWGSLWPVFNRVVLACVWFGVQSSIGGNCVELMLRAIFGNDLETRIPNHLSGNITSFKMLSFFLFWFSQIPFIIIPPHKLKYFFALKAAISPIAGISFLIWTLVKAHDVGPMMRASSSISGSAYAWTFVSAVMSCLSNLSTLIINAPDFSRFANAPEAAIWTQMLTLPISYSCTCLIGILVCSAANYMYDESYWNPLDVLSRFLDHQTPGNRAGVFLLGTCFTIAQLTSNIAANSLSAGTDMTAIFPKFINIRRGGLICAAIGYAICPWNLMSSSNNFTTYLSAYSVFLSSIAGCIFADYYLIKKGYIIIDQLFIAEKSSPYYYTWGINFRCYAAYICGILPNIVGFVGATKTHEVPIGATRTYTLSFFTGFLAASTSLFIITLIWPVDGTPCGMLERKWFEEWQEVEDFDENFRRLHCKDLESFSEESNTSV